jgi:hypothetical protein
MAIIFQSRFCPHESGEIGSSHSGFEYRSQPCKGALPAQVWRGEIYEELGKYSLALADYDRIASITPASLPLTRAFAHNSRAWLRATCPDASFRNGKQAVADAKSACHEASWSEPAYMDTLAAAHAEAGDFDSAVRFEQRAIKSVHEERGPSKTPSADALFMSASSPDTNAGSLPTSITSPGGLTYAEQLTNLPTAVRFTR